LSHIQKVEEVGPECFRIIGKEIGEDWTLCVSDPDEKKDIWFCGLL